MNINNKISNICKRLAEAGLPQFENLSNQEFLTINNLDALGLEHSEINDILTLQEELRTNELIIPAKSNPIDTKNELIQNQQLGNNKFGYLLENNSLQKVVEGFRRRSTGLSTGFRIGSIDDLKIPSGALTIIAGPSSHGKTSTLINFSLGIMKNNNHKRVYFFTYEEDYEAIFTLFLNTFIGEEISQNNRESISSFFALENDERFKYITKTKRTFFEERLKDFCENIIENGQLRIFYENKSVEELVQAIEFIKTNNPDVGLICIDYIQLLRLSKTNKPRHEELKDICDLLKNCAIKTGLPLLLAAQFNRQVTCEADMSMIHIAEGADIERYTNLIIGMWNRNFAGFNRLGNISKNGLVIPIEKTIYFEILKGRTKGNNHCEVMNYDGNAGKLKNTPNLLSQNGFENMSGENNNNPLNPYGY